MGDGIFRGVAALLGNGEDGDENSDDAGERPEDGKSLVNEEWSKHGRRKSEWGRREENLEKLTSR